MLLAVSLGDLGESLGETATIAVVESKKGLGGLAIVMSSPDPPSINVGRGDASRGLGVGAALSMKLNTAMTCPTPLQLGQSVRATPGPIALIWNRSQHAAWKTCRHPRRHTRSPP